MKTFIAIILAVLLLACDPESSSSSSKPKKPKPPVVQPVENLKITDPLYKDQWYLKNTGQHGGRPGVDINIKPVWKQGYTGEGIFVGILDDPVQKNHPDLKDNMLAVQDYYSDVPFCDPSNSDNDRNHGTNVAGIIAARDNDIGIRGIAPRAKIYSYGVLRPDGSTNSETPEVSIAKALNRSEVRKIAVYNGSLGLSGGGGTSYSHLTSQLQDRMDHVTQNGFGGKGSSLVFSVGNHSVSGRASNENLLNHYASIGVSNINYKFLLGPHSPGENVWITALSSKITTTDLVGVSCGKGYTSSFGGTSAATPMISGIIALLRQAYPQLTWRDVKLILAESAKKFDSSSTVVTGKMYSNPQKEQKFHEDVGFGWVDAAAAFSLAKNWKPLPKMKTKLSQEQTQVVHTPAKDQWYTSSLNVSGIDLNFIESVTLQMDVTKSKNEIFLYRWDLVLVAPDGKESPLYERGAAIQSASALLDGDSSMILLSNRFLGSSSVNGTWQLKIRQKRDFMYTNHYISSIQSWKLTFRGH